MDRTVGSSAAAVFHTETSTFRVRTHLIPMLDRIILRGLTAATIARTAAATVTTALGSASASGVVLTEVTAIMATITISPVSVRCNVVSH